MIIKKISLSRFKSFNLKKLSLETRLLCIELFIILFVLILAILSSSILFQTAIKNRSQEFSTLTFILSKNIEQTIKKNVAQLNNMVDIIELNDLETNKDYSTFASKLTQFDWLV